MWHSAWKPVTLTDVLRSVEESGSGARGRERHMPAKSGFSSFGVFVSSFLVFRLSGFLFLRFWCVFFAIW